MEKERNRERRRERELLNLSKVCPFLDSSVLLSSMTQKPING
jgi:hypothetical protein